MAGIRAMEAGTIVSLRASAGTRVKNEQYAGGKTVFMAGSVFELSLTSETRTLRNPTRRAIMGSEWAWNEARSATGRLSYLFMVFEIPRSDFEQFLISSRCATRQGTTRTTNPRADSEPPCNFES